MNRENKISNRNKVHETNMKELNSTRNSGDILRNLLQDLEESMQMHLQYVALSTQKENLMKKRTKTRYLELSLFDVFCEDYIEFKDCMRDFFWYII